MEWQTDFSNFGSLKSTETKRQSVWLFGVRNFSNFGSLKSTETSRPQHLMDNYFYFSNFGSLKSTETDQRFNRGLNELRISAISAR